MLHPLGYVTFPTKHHGSLSNDRHAIGYFLFTLPFASRLVEQSLDSLCPIFTGLGRF